MNLKAILLDLDGTLAESLPVMKTSYQLFMKQVNLTARDDEFDLLNGPPISIAMSYLKHTHALVETEELLLKKYSDIIDEQYTSVKPSYGALELLTKAKQNRCIIGIVTSNTRKRTQMWLETVCLDRMINFIVSSDEVKQGKPHPEPYLIAAQLTSCTLDEIVAIEDSRQGAISATAAGLKTFVVSDKSNNWPDEVQLISSLTEATKQLWRENQKVMP